MIKNCEVCQKEFYTRPTHVKKGWGRFCSMSCRSKIIKNAKGFKRTEQMIKTMRERMKGRFANEKHPMWKVKPNYAAIHYYIGRHFEKINFCESCGNEDAIKYEWANISGEYKRDRSDWLRLCKSCHQKFDNIGYKSWETRRKLYGYSGKVVQSL